jgi:uncharacterized protein (TIGR02145 family)
MKHFLFIPAAMIVICIGCSEVKTSVQIGTQIWSTQNLDVSTFRNGDTIPEAKTCDEWGVAASSGKPAWCYYNNDPSNGLKYGKLYNWIAVNDPRGLAPEGQHIPTREEWKKLESFLGRNDAAKKLKEIGWWLQENFATNEVGFNARPGGIRKSHLVQGDPPCEFDGLGIHGYFWSSTEYVAQGAFNIRLSRGQQFFNPEVSSGGRGMSVRCLLDISSAAEGNPQSQ